MRSRRGGLARGPTFVGLLCLSGAHLEHLFGVVHEGVQAGGRVADVVECYLCQPDAEVHSTKPSPRFVCSPRAL
eukprot:4574373-Pyramimonas_sp.AAC.1